MNPTMMNLDQKETTRSLSEKSPSQWKSDPFVCKVCFFQSHRILDFRKPSLIKGVFICRRCSLRTRLKDFKRKYEQNKKENRQLYQAAHGRRSQSL